MTARAIGSLLGTTSPKSYAPWKVWKGSTRGEVKFSPLSKRDAVKLFHKARRFERQTRLRGRQDGALGRNAVLVLHALVFDFLNYASGRLDPGYAAIAEKANISMRSVSRGLARLKAAGVLNWIQRCVENLNGRPYSQRQGTNAYAILPASQWHGFSERAPAPPPAPDTWGAAPNLGGVLAIGAELLRAGMPRAAQAILEADPGDGLASAVARLGRVRLLLNGQPG